MVRNDERRAQLADAGIEVLAIEGARGLTHRAVDARADVPRGTTSNYFPRREDIVTALVARIAERLAPDPAVLASLAQRQPDRELFVDYVREVVRRLDAEPHVSIALFELRLEASRRPAVADALGRWRRAAFLDDVTFNADAGLPGTSTELALLHYAVDGLMLDRLTTPLDPGTSTEAIVDDLVARILGPSLP